MLVFLVYLPLHKILLWEIFFCSPEIAPWSREFSQKIFFWTFCFNGQNKKRFFTFSTRNITTVLFLFFHSSLWWSNFLNLYSNWEKVNFHQKKFSIFCFSAKLIFLLHNWVTFLFLRSKQNDFLHFPELQNYFSCFFIVACDGTIFWKLYSSKVKVIKGRF